MAVRLEYAEGVRAGALVDLSEVDAGGALVEVRVAWMESQPNFPPGVDRKDYHAIFGFRGGYNRFWGYRPSDPPRDSTSRLERTLGALIQPDDRGRSGLQPGSYLAIVARSPEVEVGAKAVQEEAGFHIIAGSW